jgi:hypothetical protein
VTGTSADGPRAAAAPGAAGAAAARPVPRRSRRAVLASSLGLAGALAGCGSPAAFDPRSEILPSDTSTPRPVATTAARTPTLADPAVARDFFGKDLVASTRSSFGLNRAAVLPSDDPRFARMLRVSLPVNAVNDTAKIYQDGPTYGGVQMFVDDTLRSPYELYLRYYLRFPANFQFGQGGRLPGFFGTIVKDRARTDTDRFGFATRFAWRKGDEGIVYANTARPDHPVNVIGKGAWRWPTGRWICVEQGVKLNFETFADGVLLIWLDGQLVHKEQHFNPRISDKLRIGGILVTATFGDGGITYAPVVSQTIDLAAFAYGTTRLNPLPARDK